MRGAVAVLAVLGLMPVRASAGMEVRTQSTGGRVGFEQADVRPIVFSVRSRCRDAAAEQYCA